MNKKHVLISLFSTAGAVALCASPAAMAQSSPAASDQNAADVVITDFRGRPPFKRQRVSAAEIAEFARFEEQPRSADESEPASRYVITDFRGRPPYRREYVSAEEFADFARFEELTDQPADSNRSTRRGPPGKPYSRR